MRQAVVVLLAVLSFLLLSSCANKSAAPPSERPHATVVMRDGTKVAGAVVASSPTEVTLAGDDNITRTIPMKQVKSIEYGDAAVAQTAPPAKRTPSRVREEPDQAQQTAPPAKGTPSRVREEPEQAQQPAPQARTYVLPAGTQISVRSADTIDSSKAAEGQGYPAEVSTDVVDASGAVVIPRGSQAQLVIVSASQGGRFRGASDLVLDLRSVSVAGQPYQLDTGDIQQRGRAGLGANKRTAEFTGGGAALGAIIGAIAGGGRGAAIGAGAGAGAGALTQVLTKGKAIRVPAETVLTFKLDKPLRIVAAE